jgi:hypothetical protein
MSIRDEIRELYEPYRFTTRGSMILKLCDEHEAAENCLKRISKILEKGDEDGN